MNVSLTPELEQFVQERVGAGLYSTASEVVREALRLLRDREEERRARLLQLRQDVAAGLAQLDSGQSAVLDVEAIKAEGRRRLGS